MDTCARRKLRAVLLLLSVVLLPLCLAVESSVATAALYADGYGIYRQRITIDTADANATTTAQYGSVRSANEFAFYSPAAPAAAASPDHATVWTAHRRAAQGWTVCRWRTTSETPVCLAGVLTSLSSGAPTSMVYVPEDELLLVAFPEAGMVVACSAGLDGTANARVWRDALEAPASLAYDHGTNTVYVAMLNGDRVERYDPSGGMMDAPGSPFITVEQPRFVLCNTAGPQGSAALVVMSMAADGAELQLFDRAGNSIGSVRDMASEWVCDEPGEDENADGELKRVVSVAYDGGANTLYVTREGGYQLVDEYDVSGAVPVGTDRGTGRLSSTEVRDPVALVTRGSVSAPAGLADAYQIRRDGEVFVTYQRCNGSVASGATTERPLGLWLCGPEESSLVVVYSNRTVYRLAISEEGGGGGGGGTCFVGYAYVIDQLLDTDTVTDVWLTEDGDAYILHASGAVALVRGVCAASARPPVVRLNASLPAALMDVPGGEFVVRNGVPCIASRYGIACADASATTAQSSPQCGATMSDVTVTYVGKYDSLVVSGHAAAGNASRVEVHTYVNATYVEEACLGAFAGLAGSRFVVDPLSGAFGWFSPSERLLREYHPQLDRVQAVGRAFASAPPAGAAGWVLSDPLGQHGRWPSTAPPTQDPHAVPPKKTPVPISQRAGFVIVFFVIGAMFVVLALACVLCVVHELRRRRGGSRSVGANERTYEGSAEDGDEPPTEEHYALPAGLRKAIRRTLCCFSCCWNDAGRLRLCGRCLGGRVEQRYYQMSEPSRNDDEEHGEGEDLAPVRAASPSGSLASHETNVGSTPNAGDPMETDPRLGGVAMEHIEF